MMGMHFDLAYVYSFSPARTIPVASTSIYDGSYRNRRQSLALSIGKNF